MPCEARCPLTDSLLHLEKGAPTPLYGAKELELTATIPKLQFTVTPYR